MRPIPRQKACLLGIFITLYVLMLRSPVGINAFPPQPHEVVHAHWANLTTTHCFDNAMAESFFATLECELIDRRSFRTQAEARTAIFQFLEGWYNTCWRHSALGYLSPNDFERAAATLSASPLAGETLPSFSIPRASAARSQNADSRGTEPHKDILQESSAGQPQAPSEIIHHSPNHESPYLSTESG